MDRTNYTNGKGFRTASIIVGFAIMLIAGAIGVVQSFVLFPFFAILLFLYVRRATGKTNVYFILFLGATMISEILFLYDIEKFISAASLMSILSNIVLLLLMKPILKLKNSVFSKHNIIELMVGFIGVGFVMGYIAYLVLPFIPDLSIFILSLISFTITVAVCFVIPNFNSHPDNVALFGIGGAYIAEMGFAFIYAFLFNEISFLIISIFMGCFVKIVLAIYLTRIDKISTSVEGKDYI